MPHPGHSIGGSPGRPRAASAQQPQSTSRAISHVTAAVTAGQDDEAPTPPPQQQATPTLLRQALVHFTVYLLGALLLATLYFNYVLLKPLLTPLYWAVVAAVPLHSLKAQALVRFLFCSDILIASWPIYLIFK